MTFKGGSFVLIDSEVGHNMDDVRPSNIAPCIIPVMSAKQAGSFG